MTSGGGKDSLVLTRTVPLHCLIDSPVDKAVQRLATGFGVGTNPILLALRKSKIDPVTVFGLPLVFVFCWCFLGFHRFTSLSSHYIIPSKFIVRKNILNKNISVNCA